MGCLLSCFSSSESEDDAGAAVMLNVYDLTPLNNYVYWCGLGIFHSGVQVHGLEYGFGAHDFPTSGVFEVEPKSCPGFVYRCSISLGRTNMNPYEFRSFIENVANDYFGDTYHLISKNCNHFTDDVSLRLTGKPIPRWVNRLARLGAFCNCLLPDYLKLQPVKQVPEYQGLSDGSESFSIITSQEPVSSDDADQDKLLSPSAVTTDVAIVKELHR